MCDAIERLNDEFNKVRDTWVINGNEEKDIDYEEDLKEEEEVDVVKGEILYIPLGEEKIRIKEILKSNLILLKSMDNNLLYRYIEREQKVFSYCYESEYTRLCYLVNGKINESVNTNGKYFIIDIANIILDTLNSYGNGDFIVELQSIVYIYQQLLYNVVRSLVFSKDIDVVQAYIYNKICDIDLIINNIENSKEIVSFTTDLLNILEEKLKTNDGNINLINNLEEILKINYGNKVYSNNENIHKSFKLHCVNYINESISYTTDKTYKTRNKFKILNDIILYIDNLYN